MLGQQRISQRAALRTHCAWSHPLSVAVVMAFNGSLDHVVFRAPLDRNHGQVCLIGGCSSSARRPAVMRFSKLVLGGPNRRRASDIVRAVFRRDADCRGGLRLRSSRKNCPPGGGPGGPSGRARAGGGPGFRGGYRRLPRRIGAGPMSGTLGVATGWRCSGGDTRINRDLRRRRPSCDRRR